MLTTSKAILTQISHLSHIIPGDAKIIQKKRKRIHEDEK